MRLKQLVFLGRLCLFVAIATLAAAHESIIPNQPLEAPDTPRIPNLLDVLVASPNHTILVRLLQRTRLIPTLMNLMELGDSRGLTIIAPTDDGIRKKKAMEEEARLSSQAETAFTAEYSELNTQALSTWEWAMHLAKHDAKPEDEDLIAPLWTSEETRIGNVNAVLRQQLLYHMINHTLPYNLTFDGNLQKSLSDTLPSVGSAAMLTTLHRPSHRLLHEPTRPGPVPQPPSSPPHPGAEDEGGLLAGEGQKMRIAAGSKGEVWLGTDSKGLGGVRAVKADRSSRKGLVLSIDGVIDLPPSLASLLTTNPTLQYLRNLTTSTLLRSLTETAHTTFFLPTESSFEALTTVERAFIQGDWELARQDRLKLLGEHMSGIGLGQGRIGYASRLKEKEAIDMTTIFGGQIRVGTDKEGKLLVDGGNVVTEDILIENGVVHIIDKLLLPFGDLNLSVEKTLLALNASRFVSLMHSAGLQSYINASPHDNDDDQEQAEPYTFMVPRDDSIDEWWRDRQQDIEYHSKRWGNSKGIDDINATELAILLRYHIAPQRLTTENLTDGMLIGTELRDWRLKDARQKLSVEVQAGDASGSAKEGSGDVGFGDANVIADPVKVGPSIIYLISKMLEPPSDPLQTAVSSLSLSTFVAAVFSAQLDKSIKKAPAITYLVPRNEAFAALGLAMQYFLLDQARSRAELRSLVEYHAIDEIVYMKDFASGLQKYPTLEGTPIWAGRQNKSGTVEVQRGTEGRNAKILEADILTSTGVLHEIDQVEMPPTLDLTIGKLMKGAKVDTMTSLVQSAGYGWILNATSPTWEQQVEFDEDRIELNSKFPHKKKHNKDKKRHRKRHQLFSDWNQSYVILCPTDNAFTRVNLTYYYSDPEALKALVQLHIIPAPANQVLPDNNVNQLPLAIKDTSAFYTLLDSAVGGISKFGKITFRKIRLKEDGSDYFTGSAASDDSDGRNLGWMVGIADTRGTDGRKHSANVLAFGRESLSTDRNHPSITMMRKRPKEGNNGDWDSRGLGGVLTIGGVLEPYEPGWFYRWGWIALVSFIVGIVLASMGFGIWAWWHRDGRISLPEALEGEEE
jgi:solute carrier family 25 carnitine/acylcarnitine transporter 20/29